MGARGTLLAAAAASSHTCRFAPSVRRVFSFPRNGYHRFSHSNGFSFPSRSRMRVLKLAALLGMPVPLLASYSSTAEAMKSNLGWQTPVPSRVATVRQMQDLDKGATEKYGIPSILLMESAGIASFRVLQSHFGLSSGSKLVVFCGPGNNGGDGFVVARHALAAGADVKVMVLGNPASYKADAKTNYDAISKLGVSMLTPSKENLDEQIDNILEWSNICVDAIFGVGLTREVGGKYRNVIEAINKWNGPVLALDIPSGVQGDTGNVMGVAVRAHATITYGLPKLGNMLYPGHALGGKLVTYRISFPPWHDSDVSVEISRPSSKLEPRDPAGHKGSFGKVLFIAGAKGYYGAPKLASMAFLRAGGGYSRLAAPSSIIPYLAVNAGTVVFHGMPETPGGAISEKSLEDLTAISTSQDAIVIGPGLSRDPETAKVIMNVLKTVGESRIPVVVDGDALTALAESGGFPETQSCTENPGRILTPHLGELSRLLGGRPISQIRENLVKSARDAAKKYNAVVVVKGAHTLVVDSDGKDIRINPTGNSGMGTAGSGDVLTGCIAAMLASNLSPFDATVTGVFLHGMAGDVAAESLGEDGMTADDILDGVPKAMTWLRDPSKVNSKLLRRYLGPESM